MFLIKKALTGYTVFLICLFPFSFHAETKEAPWPFPSESVEQAVFMLEFASSSGLFSTGTGFVIKIKKDFYLATSLHSVNMIIDRNAVPKRISLRAKNKTGKLLEIEDIAGLSSLYDLLLIKLKKGYTGPVLKLSNEIGQDKKAYTMGFPGGQFQKVTLTEVGEIEPMLFNGFRVLNDDTIDFDRAAPQGISGGPVFNDKGEVIGINRSGNALSLRFVKSRFIETTLRVRRGFHRDLIQWIQNEYGIFSKMVKKGNPSAQFMYAEELRLRANNKQISYKRFVQEALPLYKNSADQGHLLAQIQLGDIYLMLEQPEESKKWLRLAVRQSTSINDAHFLLVLAHMLTTKDEPIERNAEAWGLIGKIVEKGLKPIFENYSKDMFPGYNFMEIPEIKNATDENSCHNSLS